MMQLLLVAIGGAFGSVARYGVGMAAASWLGLAFPAKTPAVVVGRMYRETAATMTMSDVREQLQHAGLDPVVKDPQAFRAYVKTELAKWTKLIKDAGIAAE